MTRDRLHAVIAQDEGTGPMKNGRFLPYWDCCGQGLRAPSCDGPIHPGKLTLGYGRNIEDRGLSFVESEDLLDHDVADATLELKGTYPWFDALDAIRQAVLIQMNFNMGLPTFSGFTNTLAAVARGDYAAAAKGMLVSRWAKQVGGRARRLAAQMKTGVEPRL
jgi:lysozyme